MTGEFGRTPRIGASTGNNNTRDGRDHWSAVFSAAFAGGGVQGGQVIGQSDKIGAYPAGRPYTPADFAATVYQSLGIDPATEVRDRLEPADPPLHRRADCAPLLRGANRRLSRRRSPVEGRRRPGLLSGDCPLGLASAISSGW